LLFGNALFLVDGHAPRSASAKPSASRFVSDLKFERELHFEQAGASPHCALLQRATCAPCRFERRIAATA
jgi:hypothetical protein